MKSFIVITGICFFSSAIGFLNKYDVSEITWAHAVNDKKKLSEALESNIHMLEADISYGNVLGESPPVLQPIMAHPPETTSDLSLEQWINTVLGSTKRKGIKLDFKDIDSVEKSLQLLKSKNGQLRVLWLNADILKGPVDAPRLPVDPHLFLQLCKSYFPNSTLSIGWTTYWNNSIQSGNVYQWEHVIEMARLLRNESVTQPVTFPVRASFVGKSIKQLKFLTDAINGSSLTVWGSKDDTVSVSDLLLVRSTFPKNKVFYDLPSPLNEEFERIKSDGSISNFHKSYCKSMETKNWLVEDKSCAFTGSNSAVIFGECFIMYRDSQNRTPPQTVSAVIEFISPNSTMNPNDLEDSVALFFPSEPWVWLHIYLNGSIKYHDHDEIFEMNSLDLQANRCYRIRFHEPGHGQDVKFQFWALDCSTSAPLSGKSPLNVKMALGGLHTNRDIIAFRGSGKLTKVIRDIDITCRRQGKSVAATHNVFSIQIMLLLFLCFSFYMF